MPCGASFNTSAQSVLLRGGGMMGSAEARRGDSGALHAPLPLWGKPLRGLSNQPYGRRLLFHRGLNAGRHPTFAGCEPYDIHGVFCEYERGWFAYLYGHAITKQRPFFHAPRACGVLPCIKPTVKTVGASPHAYQSTERRRMAVWISANDRIPPVSV